MSYEKKFTIEVMHECGARELLVAISSDIPRKQSNNKELWTHKISLCQAASKGMILLLQTLVCQTLRSI